MRQKLLRESRRRGLTVIYGPLPTPLRALYQRSKNLIIITRGLNHAQEIEALAHELGHAHYGHDCTNDRTETQAWRWAAEFLVNVDEYAHAELINPHPNAIALELELTPRIITEWQKHHGHRYERIAA